MILLYICAPPALWFLSKESFPRLSKLFGFVSLALVVVLLLNIINSI